MLAELRCQGKQGWVEWECLCVPAAHVTGLMIREAVERGKVSSFFFYYLEEIKFCGTYSIRDKEIKGDREISVATISPLWRSVSWEHQ